MQLSPAIGRHQRSRSYLRNTLPMNVESLSQRHSRHTAFLKVLKLHTSSKEGRSVQKKFENILYMAVLTEKVFPSPYLSRQSFLKTWVFPEVFFKKDNGSGIIVHEPLFLRLFSMFLVTADMEKY